MLLCVGSSAVNPRSTSSAGRYETFLCNRDPDGRCASRNCRASSGTSKGGVGKKSICPSSSCWQYQRARSSICAASVQPGGKEKSLTGIHGGFSMTAPPAPDFQRVV